MTNKSILEKDLYNPLKSYLISQGYDVYSEVKNCDIVATKNKDLVIIEMKKSLNLTLLVQATNRQRTNASVYIAIIKPKGGVSNKKWRTYIHLIKRLELGFIIVSFKTKQPLVKILFHPIKYQQKTNNKMKKSIIQEINGRYADYNQGGVNKTKLVTAYRESAIYIACILNEFGEMSAKNLKKLGTDDKTLSILYNNHYGWFERIDRGIYKLTSKGELEVKQYKELFDYFNLKLSNMNSK